MKIQRSPLSLSAVAALLQRAIALLSPFSTAPRLVPIPSNVSPRSSSARYAHTSPGWRAGRLVLLWAISLVILSSVSAWAGHPALPSGVPNIFDPEVQDQFEMLGVTNLGGNPDFPMVLLMNTGEDAPQAILLAMDARNGGETWSIKSDPIILIITFTDPTTIQTLLVDIGFADQGKASGKYATVDDQNSPVLPDLLKAIGDTSKRTSI
jgi:hypothetical protein